MIKISVTKVQLSVFVKGSTTLQVGLLVENTGWKKSLVRSYKLVYNQPPLTFLLIFDPKKVFAQEFHWQMLLNITFDFSIFRKRLQNWRQNAIIAEQLILPYQNVFSLNNRSLMRSMHTAHMVMMWLKTIELMQYFIQNN